MIRREINSKTQAQPPLATPLSLPSKVKERHRDFAQQFWSFPLFVGVWGAAGILVQHPEQSEAQYGLQGENSYCYGEVDPMRDKESVVAERKYKQHAVGIVIIVVIGEERRGHSNRSQFVPFDVVEEAFVCAHSLGLDRFKQVLAIVCE